MDSFKAAVAEVESSLSEVSVPSSLDLQTLAEQYRSTAASPVQLIEDLLVPLAESRVRGIWIHLVEADELRSQAAAVCQRAARGEYLPLYGVPFAVKDNYNVAGYPTTAGCPAYSYVADSSAPVIERLMDVGAIFVGKTNLDQFSTGLAGDRTPFGVPQNPFNPERISGGSSSGSAVAVASGLVSFALGTDTAGSGRVPAGCNNVVGLKPTPGRLSTVGVVPACRSLDCVSVFALTVGDAWSVYDVLVNATKPETLGERRSPSSFRFAIPRANQSEFWGDEGQAELFERSIEHLRSLGGEPVEVDFGPFLEVGALLYEGPWLAERLAHLGPFLRQHAAEVLPVTRQVIEGGSRFSAVDYFRATERLDGLRAICSQAFRDADFLVVPTVPALPTSRSVIADSAAWSRRLGYYTNFVNLLRLPALALPAGFTASGLPGGITAIGRSGTERELCEFGVVWQRNLGLNLGATSWTLPAALPPALAAEPSPAQSPEGFVRVAVAGAHLRGQPLHGDLQRWGAHFVRTCRTAPIYRFLGLLHLAPPRPGLLRDEARAGTVELEIYDMPWAGFGRLVASVAPPLAIGTVQLADGERVKGFLCESFAEPAALDITDFGGWRAYLQHVSKPASATDGLGPTADHNRSISQTP